MDTNTSQALPYVEILPPGAPREVWLEERRQGIGGSDASAVAGVNPWRTRWAVWLDKTGQAVDVEPTRAMRMGTLLEPVVKALFVEETGIALADVGLLRSLEWPFMQVTPDGFTADGGIFESKTTSRWLSHEWDDGQVPDHAEVQVQHALAVTGRSHAWVAGLIDGLDLRVVRVERDEKMIAALVSLEERFWVDNVLGGDAPGVVAGDVEHFARIPADVESVTADDPARVVDLLDRWEAAKENVKAAEEYAAGIEAELRQVAGTAEQVIDAEGAVLFTVKQNGTFAASRFKSANPSLWDELQVLRPVLDTEKLKANHPEEYNAHRARVLRRPKRKK